MRIAKIISAAPGAPYRRGPGRASGAQGAPRPSAGAEPGLPAPVAAPARRTDAADGRSFARLRTHSPFLAQLFASSIGLPQTRRRRRASPQDGTARYAAVFSSDRPAPMGMRKARTV